VILGIDMIDAFHGDCQHAVVDPFDPALCPQIPEVKFELLDRAAECGFELKLGKTRLPDVLAALSIEGGEQFVLDINVVTNELVVSGLFVTIHGRAKMLLIARIILLALDAIFKHAVRFDNEVKPIAVPRIRIVRVIEHRKTAISLHNLYCVGPWADLQNHIIV